MMDFVLTITIRPPASAPVARIWTGTGWSDETILRVVIPGGVHPPMARGQRGKPHPDDEASAWAVAERLLDELGNPPASFGPRDWEEWEAIKRSTKGGAK